MTIMILGEKVAIARIVVRKYCKYCYILGILTNFQLKYQKINFETKTQKLNRMNKKVLADIDQQ